MDRLPFISDLSQICFDVFVNLCFLPIQPHRGFSSCFSKSTTGLNKPQLKSVFDIDILPLLSGPAPNRIILFRFLILPSQGTSRFVFANCMGKYG